MSEPPKDGLHVEYYDNGQKKVEAPFKDGKLDGLLTGWYENGKKRAEGHYKDGKIVSASSWKSDGKPCPITRIVDGSGTVVSWYENGRKWSEEHYKNGEWDGLMTAWHENGQKWQEYHYKDGKQEGLATEWHENGQKKSEEYYKEGKPAYFTNGKLVVQPLNTRPVIIVVTVLVISFVLSIFYGIFFSQGELLSNGKANLFVMLVAVSNYTCWVLLSIALVLDVLASGLSFASYIKKKMKDEGFDILFFLSSFILRSSISTGRILCRWKHIMHISV